MPWMSSEGGRAAFTMESVQSSANVEGVPAFANAARAVMAMEAQAGERILSTVARICQREMKRKMRTGSVCLTHRRTHASLTLYRRSRHLMCRAVFLPQESQTNYRRHRSSGCAVELIEFVGKLWGSSSMIPLVVL